MKWNQIIQLGQHSGIYESPFKSHIKRDQKLKYINSRPEFKVETPSYFNGEHQEAKGLKPGM